MTDMPPLPAPPFADRCPNCPSPAFVLPFAKEEDCGEIWCAYGCVECGHGWVARWLLDALGVGYGGAA